MRYHSLGGHYYNIFTLCTYVALYSVGPFTIYIKTGIIRSIMTSLGISEKNFIE